MLTKAAFSKSPGIQRRNSLHPPDTTFHYKEKYEFITLPQRGMSMFLMQSIEENTATTGNVTIPLLYRILLWMEGRFLLDIHEKGASRHSQMTS
jgi:hypothetical protein